MTRKEWIAVGVVIGLGIVAQIPRHDGATSASGEPHAHARGEAPAAGDAGALAPVPAPEVARPYRTIALEVTGMT